MIFVIFENSLSTQLAYLGRKSAALDLKIIGKLLPVKIYIKAV